MDIADAADLTIEHELAYQLARSRANAAPAMPRGQCLYCGDACADRYYCDADCQADYEYEQRIKAKQHKLPN